MGSSVPLRRELPATITLHLFLVLLVVIWGVDVAALFSSSIHLNVVGLSSSVCTVVKQPCKGTSGVGENIFLLQVLGVAVFHSSVLLSPLPSACAAGGISVCLTMGCGSLCSPEASLTQEIPLYSMILH